MRLTEEQKWCIAYLEKSGASLRMIYINVPKNCDEIISRYALVKLSSSDKYTKMAEELKNLWPNGSREINGKEYPWQDSLDNISKRLSVVFKKRHLKKFTTEDVLSVARRYLSRFEDNSSYMKSLQFWILRTERKYGFVEEKSTLADMLENKDFESTLSEFSVNDFENGEII